MRTTTLLAIILLLAASTSGHAGGPGRNLRPGLTRSTQVNAISVDGPKAPEPAGPIRTVVSLSLCLAAIVITSLIQINRHDDAEEDDPTI